MTTSSLLRSSSFAALLIGTLCSAQASGSRFLKLAARMSPAAETLSPAEAQQKASEYVAAHPGAQIEYGTGDSMMPLYKDNTMIVVQNLPISQLKPGMTIVYRSKQGWPVAHALVSNKGGELVTQGLNNPGVDGEKIGADNYVGVVVKAYQLNVNPMLALSRALHAEGQLAQLAMAGN